MNMRGLSLRDLMSAADDDARQSQSAPVVESVFSTPARPATKASLGFILGHQSDDDTNQADVAMRDNDGEETQSEHEGERRRHVDTSSSSAARGAIVSDASARKTKKRKARICKEPGCQKYVVDHGLCIRHGGGKRCSVEDCNCRAQNRGLCWKHGGYTICKIEDCTKRAKSRGICWSHGGGTRCKDDGCTKIAVSHGKCWAHGGGKRCIVDGCKRPASERTDNCCADHYGGRLPEHAGI